MMKIYNQKEDDFMAVVNESVIAYGTADSGSIFSLIDYIKRGIKFPLFEHIVEKSAFGIHEWSKFLHLSERTIQRYKKENKSFDPIYSEKIIEITMLFKYGTEIFGDEANFNIWLQTPNIALGGLVPKGLLDNTFGINLIKDELTRIANGVLA